MLSWSTWGVSALRKSMLILLGLVVLGPASVGIAAAPPPAEKDNPRPVPQKFYAPVFKKETYGSEVSINDRCPVKHGKLTTNIRPSYVNRLPVGYCCHGCPPIFTEDPGTYLSALKITVPDPVDSKRVASYDPSLRVFLNQEAYFFAGKDTKTRFLADPLRYSGPLTDPVSQKSFKATAFSPKTKYKDRTFYFESKLTQRQFAVSPKDYANRREN
jgi:YHS domain-containing protein